VYALVQRLVLFELYQWLMGCHADGSHGAQTFTA
jgi:hypothetical protein